jgi:dephospho-CoA kinase
MSSKSAESVAFLFFFGVIMIAMLHVGLTGNIASGKSCAASLFAELGAHIIDADHVVHDLLLAGTKTHAIIVAAFGEEILCLDREIDRKKLGQLVFFDEQKRLLLNQLTHPDVGSEILKRIVDIEQEFTQGLVIVDAALMVETGGYRLYDKLIVITCDPALQIARLMTRDNLTEIDARARMDSQMPIEEKLKLADYTIDTSGTLRQTQEQVEAIYRTLMVEELRLKERQK